MMAKKPAIVLSAWFYRRLLILYPSAFRRAYGDQMLQVFITQCRQAHGGSDFLQVWFLALVDLISNSTEEGLMSVFNKISLNIKMILRFGLVAGILGGVNAVTSAALVGKVGEEVISDITLLSIAALIIASGLVTARVSGNPLTGLWAGLAVGLIVSLMATAARVGYSVVFFDFVLRDPAEILGWAHRGSATFVDYLVQDRLGGFINTTLFLGVMGALCGVLGGWMGTLRGFHKNGWRETA